MTDTPSTSSCKRAAPTSGLVCPCRRRCRQAAATGQHGWGQEEGGRRQHRHLTVQEDGRRRGQQEEEVAVQVQGEVGGGS